MKKLLITLLLLTGCASVSIEDRVARLEERLNEISPEGYIGPAKLTLQSEDGKYESIIQLDKDVLRFYRKDETGEYDKFLLNMERE